jgi:hypothetical protein
MNHTKTGVNLGAPDGSAVPTPLVIVLFIEDVIRGSLIVESASKRDINWCPGTFTRGWNEAQVLLFSV